MKPSRIGLVSAAIASAIATASRNMAGSLRFPPSVINSRWKAMRSAPGAKLAKRAALGVLGIRGRKPPVGRMVKPASKQRNRRGRKVLA